MSLYFKNTENRFTPLNFSLLFMIVITMTGCSSTGSNYQSHLRLKEQQSKFQETVSTIQAFFGPLPVRISFNRQPAPKDFRFIRWSLMNGHRKCRPSQTDHGFNLEKSWDPSINRAQFLEYYQGKVPCEDGLLSYNVMAPRATHKIVLNLQELNRLTYNNARTENEFNENLSLFRMRGHEYGGMSLLVSELWSNHKTELMALSQAIRHLKQAILGIDDISDKAKLALQLIVRKKFEHNRWLFDVPFYKLTEYMQFYATKREIEEHLTQYRQQQRDLSQK